MGRLVVLLIACGVGACSNGGGGGGDMSVGSDGGTSVVMASQTVGAAGGTVAVTDSSSPIAGASVTIPPGALPADTTITISQVTSGSPFPADALTVDFGPSGTTFSVPVTVTVPYAQQYFDGNGLTDPSALHVVTQSTNGARQTLRKTTVDAASRLVSGPTTHFSPFVVLGFTNASLSAAYTLLQYSFFHTVSQPTMPAMGSPLPSPLGFSAINGEVSFDGTSMVAVIALSGNQDGMPNTPSGGSQTYTVDGSGMVTIGQLQGQVLADGSLAALVSTGGNPQIALLVSRRGTFDPSMLNGDYQLVQYSRFSTVAQPNAPAQGMPLPSPLGFATVVGTVSFDGIAHFHPSMFSGNQDGTALSPSIQDGTYHVLAADGTVTLGNLTGAMTAGGGFVALVSTSGDPMLVLLVRKATAPTPDTVGGPYTLLQFNHFSTVAQPNAPAQGTPLPTPRGFETGVLWLSVNAPNIVPTAVTGNQDGYFQKPSVMNTTYGFAAGGVLSVGGGKLVGAAPDDGSLFVLGPTSGDPGIAIALLK